MTHRPIDITLPEGWTWERVEAQRTKWGISDDFIPVAQVPGAAVAWATINSERASRLTLKINGVSRRAKDVAEVSAIYTAARDAFWKNGGRRFADGKVYDETGTQIAYVSQNGRVWRGTEYQPNAVPLFDNRI